MAISAEILRSPDASRRAAGIDQRIKPQAVTISPPATWNEHRGRTQSPPKTRDLVPIHNRYRARIHSRVHYWQGAAGTERGNTLGQNPGMRVRKADRRSGMSRFGRSLSTAQCDGCSASMNSDVSTHSGYSMQLRLCSQLKQQLRST
jgi:hypothetical protein